MRFLNTETLELCQFWDHEIPPYAILSHTWEEEEVTFQEMSIPVIEAVKAKKGYHKIAQFCKIARSDGCLYGWVDTCCIDKSSSAELSEAINSMFKWYQRSNNCYAYLSDYNLEYVDKDALRSCRWFTRGWTLQELIAPQQVVFYNRDWEDICWKTVEVEMLSSVTGIDLEVFFGRPLTAFSHAERMSWAAKRQTTRSEDTAYCLLGIFGINMPLLYGEGSRAFLRLQEIIMSQSADDSLLVWDRELCEVQHRFDLIAATPAYFATTQDVICPKANRDLEPPLKCSITDIGVYCELPISISQTENGDSDERDEVVSLRCYRRSILSTPEQRFALILKCATENGVRNVATVITTSDDYPTRRKKMYIAQRSHVWRWCSDLRLHKHISVYLYASKNFSFQSRTEGAMREGHLIIDLDGGWQELGDRMPTQILLSDRRHNACLITIQDCPFGVDGPTLSIHVETARHDQVLRPKSDVSWSVEHALNVLESESVSYKHPTANWSIRVNALVGGDCAGVNIFEL